MTVQERMNEWPEGGKAEGQAPSSSPVLGHSPPHPLVWLLCPSSILGYLPQHSVQFSRSVLSDPFRSY